MTAVALLSRALYEEVAELLRQRIFSRELPPGAWIDELKIAEELGISRTPLREAIKVLAAEGLVTIKVRRGAYVTEVSQQDLREVYELLALLESDAAESACWRATQDDLAALERLLAELEVAADSETGSPERFFELSEAFHLRLLDLGHNRRRKQLVCDLRKVMKLSRHGSLSKQRIAASVAEHRAIVDALRRRDAAGAAQAVRQHFANGLQAAV
ncbi:MAG: GntR family transcriptional regulator [Tepidimonas sp.]|uniref:GntR family transcriptional regulator n=1 Tax=Tepidimonas sp. TaxID=2002775 RepID=UPI004054E67E